MLVAVQKMYYFGEIMAKNDWTEYLLDKKEGLLVEVRDDEKLNCLRSSCIIEYSVDDIFQVLGNQRMYRKWFDKNIDQAYLVRKIGPQTFYSYELTEKFFLVRRRDFILCTHFNRVSA